MDKEILRYENKMKNCRSMTELMTVMASWQSYCRSHAVEIENEQKINSLYLEMEGKLISNLKLIPW